MRVSFEWVDEDEVEKFGFRPATYYRKLFGASACEGWSKGILHC